MIRQPLLYTLLITVATGLVGCGPAVHFPGPDMPEAAQLVGAFRAYDADRDGTADFFLFTNDLGRVDRIGFGLFGLGRGGPQTIVHLDELDLAAAPHVVIILDGIGYDVLRAFYDRGHLRYFHAPSRVVAPYPSMTDLCLEDALTHRPARGVEAKYFDRNANAIAGGSLAYLRGDNQPYQALLHYRADLIMDALGYIAPSRVYRHELNAAKKAFDKRTSPEFIAYFVSSAGLGTAKGQAGQIEVLVNVERLVNQLMYETRGQVRLTMFSDHGHCYTRGTRIPLEKHLQARGWNVTDTLKGPRDVVYVRFGLVTCANFSTDSPAALATDLAAAEGVEVASHAEDGRVVVYGPAGGKAVIGRAGDSYTYEMREGDPLKLREALATISANPDGSYNDADLLAATADCEYPFALQRLWRAHFGLVENPPDVIVSLADAYYSGTAWMDFFATVASTHGSLNRVNSTTFAMTTLAPLPPVMQSRDLAPALGTLLGEPFPKRKP